jgi:hypothetical protein
MRKLFGVLLLVTLVATIPLTAGAKQAPGAVDVVGGVEAPGYPAQAAPHAVPDALLYDNGPMVTHPGACGGADASRLQNLSLLLNTYGFGHQLYYGYRVADDFEITDPMGWDLDAIQFFAYQTGSPTNPSTITQVNYRVLDAAPPGGNVLCGDTVTNKLTTSVWTNIYRDYETTTCGTTRPIMEDTVSIHAPCAHLGPGVYWLDWQTDGTLASGPWAPPITILGQTTTGNALQSLDYGVTYSPALDTGTSTQQGLPFRIFGTIPPPPECWTHLFKTKVNWAYTARPGWVKTVFAGIVHDQDHARVVGATVTGHWIINGVGQPPATFVTTPLGQFKFPWKSAWAAPGWYDFCVDNIQYGNCGYDWGANETDECRLQDIPPPPQ